MRLNLRLKWDIEELIERDKKWVLVDLQSLTLGRYCYFLRAVPKTYSHE